MKDSISYFKNRFLGSLAKTPKPEGLLTGKSGLSPEFIEKYDLTKRQTDVTEVLLRGKRDREIAALLDIELNTVKTHLKKVYKKTGVRGRCALMVLVGRGYK